MRTRGRIPVGRSMAMRTASVNCRARCNPAARITTSAEKTISDRSGSSVTVSEPGPLIRTSFSRVSMGSVAEICVSFSEEAVPSCRGGVVFCGSTTVSATIGGGAGCSSIGGSSIGCAVVSTTTGSAVVFTMIGSGSGVCSAMSVICSREVPPRGSSTAGVSSTARVEVSIVSAPSCRAMAGATPAAR